MKYDSRMKINMTEKTSVEKTWKAYLNKIEPADRTAMELAKKRWNSVAKPIGSLGILEEDIIKIAGIRGNASGMKLDRSALAVMCADHPYPDVLRTFRILLHSDDAGGRG